MPNYRQGFTLIELLVVIAVISLLASIILATLKTARYKATDSAIMAQVIQIRNSTEQYYIEGERNSYNVVCFEDANVYRLKQDIDAANGNGTIRCDSDYETWVMAADLVSQTAYFCVDSTGKSKIIPGALGTPTFTACP